MRSIEGTALADLHKSRSMTNEDTALADLHKSRSRTMDNNGGEI